MRRSSVVLAVAVSVLASVPVLADAVDTVDRPATVAKPAVRMPYSGDVVTVYNVGSLRDDVASRAIAAARAAGGSGAITRSASIGMQRVRRGSAVVQQAPPGYAFPMATTVLPPEVVGPIIGFDVSAALSATDIVMGRLSAELRGAQAGDAVDLVASGGSVVTFTIRSVVDDDVLGGTELLLTTAAADRLGLSRLSSAILWGMTSRDAIDTQLEAEGLVSTTVRIRRSWDPQDPDGTLGMAATKAALGEFAYRVGPSGSVGIDPDWKSTNITLGAIGGLTLRSGCHRTVRIALTEAFDDLVAAGLENTINYTNANRAGGCYSPRFSRLAPNSNIGFLSRHTWGMAIDTNTVGSCQGCAPPDFATMSGGCDAVRIFRKHGFAWGGNFLFPDGMHFEWVGAPRDQLDYPSRYCPNVITTSQLQSAESPFTQRATLFADAGLLADG